MDMLVLRKLPLIVSTAIYSALTMHAGLAHSAGIVADGSTATDVTTVNQVDIVNIATPTAGGVSQNHFSRFSIDSNGAVMNNSTLDGTSALAGQVQANTNLSSGSAKIILNEVTSNRQSNLNGTTEIFGDNARYILSNPNGITCDGCGFIRTPTDVGDVGTSIQDVFLTTGTATVNPTTGLPITFTIDDKNQAQIIIGQNGLDARNVDITTLLTRQAEINGIIDAASNQLNVYLGKGTLSVNDNTASTWVTDTSGRTVNVAIDANSAGAMYAGQIFIQATEDGAGVTLPDDLISTGGISISAAGDIVYRDATAQAGDIAVATTGTNTDITSTGSTTASANITLNATGDVSYNNATASGNVTLNGVDDVSYNNATAQTGNVTVTTQTATAQISTSGNTTAAGNISWNMSGTAGRITGTGSPAIFNAGSTILFNCTAGDGDCDIQSQRELILQAALLQSNANISTSSGNNLTVNAAVSSSQGFNSGANATFTSTAGDLNIAGSLIAANNIQLTSALNAQIILDGNVQAGGDIAFLGQGSYTHDTLGTFNIGGSYQFDLFGLTNNVILANLQNGTLRVNELTNNGLIENQAALNLKVDDVLINTGIIASLEGAVSIGHTDVNLKTNSINNSGVIASIDLTNSQLGQTGLILDPAALIDQHTQKILNGEQRSAEELAIEIETRNAALIAELNANATVTGVVSISANTLTNTASGRISGSDVSLLIDTLNNQGGQILAGRNLSIQGATLTNSNTIDQFGVLTARDNLNINLTSSFTNTGLVDGGYVTVIAPVQDNIGSGFSIASLLGAKLDTTAQVNPLSLKPWFEAGTGDTQYQFINAFNNSVIDSNLTRLSDAFILSSGATIDANNKMVGDDVYIAELLVNTLRSEGGVPFVTTERDALGQLNSLYNNTQAYMTQTGLGFGEIPDVIQQSQIIDPALVFVAQDQGNGVQVYVPQIWMPTSGEGINAQDGRINTQIIAANDLFLEGEKITSLDADLIAGENLVIEAVDFTVSGNQRKWYVDATGQVHYHNAQIVAGDSVLVKLSGNYVQKGAKVLAANELVVQAKTINVSNQRQTNLKHLTGFNVAQGEKRQLWSSLLGLGLQRASLRHKSKTDRQPEQYAMSTNMMANSVLLKAEDDITLTRVDIRSTSRESNNAGSVMLIADKGSINNLGSVLESDSIYMQAGKDITNKSLQTVQNNRTRVNGKWSERRWGYYSDDDTQTYSQTTTRSQNVITDVAEIKAGDGGLVQIAGNDINNLGGIISSEGNIVQQATGNITNKSLATRYLENQTTHSAGSRNGWYGSRVTPRNLKNNSSTTKYNTAIQLASITAKGDLIQDAGNKIINVGSTTTVTGNIIQSAKDGIENTNLLSSNTLRSKKRAVQTRGYGYDDDSYRYNRYRRQNRDTDVLTTTENAVINNISAGGSLIVSVEDGDYINKGNISAKDHIEISANTIRNSREVIGTGNNARVIDSGNVSAGGDIKFIAKTDIIDTAGRYDAKGNILFNAKENITQNVIALRKDYNNETLSPWGFVSGYDKRTSITNTRGSFNSDGVTALQAGEDLSLTGSTITASDIELRGNNITLGAARNLQERKWKQGRTNTINRTVNHDVVNLNSQGNIFVQADKNLITQGSSITAGNQAGNYLVLNAGGNMLLDGVNNETYSYYYHHQKRSWGRSRTTIREQQRVRSQGTQIAVENLLINTNIDELAAAEVNNVSFIGSQIEVGNEAIINAKGDVNVYAALNYNYDMSESRKKGFGGFSSSSKGSRRSQQLLNASNLESRQGDLSLLAGNNITVVASNLTSGGNLNLQAENDVLIAAAEQAGSYDEWSTKSGFFTGGAIFSKSEELEGKLTKTAMLANLSGGNILINARNNIAFTGVDIAATKSLAVSAQDIVIKNAQNEEKTYSKHSKMSVGLGDIVKNLANPGKVIQKKDGKFSITLAKAQYSKADKTTTKNTVVSSNLAADKINLNVNSDDSRRGDINITGSNVVANDVLNLSASNGVTIKEAKEREQISSKEQKGEADLKFTIKNEYEQIGYAVKAAKAAKKQLKHSRQAYNQYKKDLSDQNDNLNQLKEDFKNGRVGIEQVDIDELQEYINELKEDGAFYKANIALAVSDLAAKTTAVAGQMATAAASTATYGFNAGLELDIDLLEKQYESYREQSIASNLVGKNINININAGNSTTVQGSNMTANEQIIIDSSELNIFASTDLNTSNENSEHKNLNISYTVYGGGNVSASADRSNGSSRDITQHNSQLAANNIQFNTDETTTITGANIAANDSLYIKTKNLNISSMQDSNRTHSQSQGLSLSGGKGGLSGGGINNGNSRLNTKETVLTSLIGNRVNIIVEENTTLKGATIAAVDVDGNDNGNLTFTTNTLVVSSLNNIRHSKSSSLDIGIGNTVSLDYTNDNNHNKTKTLGTIGEGNVQVANLDESNTILLNRDVNNNEISIYEIESHKGLKGSLDTRMLTEEGRKEISKEFKEFGKNMQLVAKGLPESDNKNKLIAVVGEILDTLSKYTGGVIPSHATNGGVLGNVPVMLGDDDINHKVLGDKSSKNVYVNGIMNNEQDARQGADNIIGIDKDKQIWLNPSHGAIADLLESTVDLLNGIGLQTGISSQIEELQKINKELNIHMHSQGNAVTAEGARNTKNGHTYNSYGAPMSESSVDKTFVNDKGKEPKVHQRNDGDYVAKPLNIFKPSTWGEPGHGTENYGAAKAQKERQEQ